MLRGPSRGPSLPLREWRRFIVETVLVILVAAIGGTVVGEVELRGLFALSGLAAIVAIIRQLL